MPFVSKVLKRQDFGISSLFSLELTNDITVTLEVYGKNRELVGEGIDLDCLCGKICHAEKTTKPLDKP